MKKRFMRVMAVAIALSMVAPPGAFALTDAELRAYPKFPGALELSRVPDMAHLDAFVSDRNWAIVLGKALFWEKRAGGDGQTACATCHFHAGADSRAKNQISPGLLGNDTSFGVTPTGGGGPNYTLEGLDFPFPKELNDVVSSQGVFLREYLGFQLGDADYCTPQPDFFKVGSTNVRRVEPRNTPTTINAVFNHRNFWDGRANNMFNGLDPLGRRSNVNNPGQGIWELQGRRGPVVKKQILLKNSSLASQAVGPPLSEIEMSCGAARSFPDLGRKLLRMRALESQTVATTDSVLGPYVHASGKGLTLSYDNLVRRAFNRKYWGASGTIENGFSQMEANFSLFWGLAIQLYEATLVSHQTPYDAFARGDDDALSPEAKRGLEVFLDKGRCINCHDGPEFTGASVALRANQPDGNEEPIERMRMGDNLPAVYDGGFYNIGVRQTLEDLGVGADLAGFPLSFSRQIVNGSKVDDFNFNPAEFEIDGPIVTDPPERVAVDGAFKTPTVRNVELTAPYMHSGGHATLRHVVEFYDSGAGKNGAFPGFAVADDTFLGNEDNLDPDIVLLGLTEQEEDDLIAFMKALTDERVRMEKAPFDHPELPIPNGHPNNQSSIVDTDGNGEADDAFVLLPAVGAAGRAIIPANFLQSGAPQ